MTNKYTKGHNVACIRHLLRSVTLAPIILKYGRHNNLWQVEGNIVSQTDRNTCVRFPNLVNIPVKCCESPSCIVGEMRDKEQYVSFWFKARIS